MSRLIRSCPPLDINSEYLYFLIGHDFSPTSVVAETGSGLAGFISGYYRPHHINTLFIWQVAVHPGYRGQGVASKMLEWLTQKNPFDVLETTISPSNKASLSLFQSHAKKHNLRITSQPFLAAFTNDAGEEHEREDLIQLLPHDIIGGTNENI